MINETVNFAIMAIIMASLWWLCPRYSDSEPQGFALSFNDWQKINYLMVNGKYYRIHPPNVFESEQQRRKRYRKYCNAKNRRRYNV